MDRELAGATCVLVLWSRDAVESDWVWSDAQDGLDRGVLVPVRLEAVRLPLPFRNLQTVDLSGWPISTKSVEFQRLLENVRQQIAARKGEEASGVLVMVP